MISGLQIALQNAIDVIAPPATPLQDFTYYWKQLMNFYVNHLNDSKVLVETTGIPRQLDRLLEILLEEEKHGNEPGPCLEYLLQHRLLDLLATLACAETPAGMRQVCLSFLKKLLTRSKHPLLHHAVVYGAVQRFIAMCNGKVASPIENEEIQFLLSLCFLVCRYPHVTNIVNESNNIQSNVASQLQYDSEKTKIDHQQVTYDPANKSKTNNPLFKTLSTQAVTLVNPDLIKSLTHHSHFDDFAKKSHTRNDLTRSNSSSQSSGSTRDIDISQTCSPIKKKVHDEKSTYLVSEDRSYKVPESDFDPILAALDLYKDLKLTEYRDKHDITLTDSGMPDKSKCLLLDAIKSYINSADNTVRIRACEGLIVLSSLDDPFFAEIIAKSDLSAVLTKRLETLFNMIPANVEPSEIEEISVTWGLDSPPLTSKFPGCRKIASFFMWFDFCAQFSREAHPDVAEALAQCIRTNFMEKLLAPALSAHHAVLITALITKCLKEILSSPLSTEICQWLVGQQRDPDIPDVWCYPVVHRLIENCHTDNDDLTIETLKLFEQMIERKDEHILHCLVLTYLNTRGYYDNGAADSAIASWSEEEDEREKKSTVDMAVGTGYSRTMAPSNIHRILNCFLSLIPRQLQTESNNQCSPFMMNWEKQYSTVVKECALLAWPLEAVSLDDSCSSDSRPGTDNSSVRFYPGPFLTMLLERIFNIPKQKYEINLQLTTLVSKLALLPHPYLHEFLLNPLIPLLAGEKSLFKCLQKMVKQLMNEVPKIPNYKQALKDTRIRLFNHCCQQTYTIENHNRSKEDILLESVVVTEEFCKELAAIAYVKYHYSL